MKRGWAYGKSASPKTLMRIPYGTRMSLDDDEDVMSIHAPRGWIMPRSAYATTEMHLSLHEEIEHNVNTFVYKFKQDLRLVRS